MVDKKNKIGLNVDQKKLKAAELNLKKIEKLTKKFEKPKKIMVRNENEVWLMETDQPAT